MFVHGMMDSCAGFAYENSDSVALELLNEGWDVYFLTYRGHTESDFNFKSIAKLWADCSDSKVNDKTKLDFYQTKLLQA